MAKLFYLAEVTLDIHGVAHKRGGDYIFVFHKEGEKYSAYPGGGDYNKYNTMEEAFYKSRWVYYKERYFSIEDDSVQE